MNELKDSDSLIDFYSRRFSTSDGAVREIDGSAERTMENFAKEKKDFQDHLEESAEIIEDSDKDIWFVDQVLSVAEAVWSEYENTNLSKSERLEIFKEIYCSQYYVYAKAKEYLSKARKHTQKIKDLIDLNDAIDWKIAAHLNLTDELVLVSEDKSLVSPVSEGIKKYRKERILTSQ